VQQFIVWRGHLFKDGPKALINDVIVS